MKEIVNHPVYGEIIYTEGFWTGKKTLTVNGIAAKTVSKKEFLIGDQKAVLKGNILTGANLTINNETVSLSPRPKWYEIVLAVLPIFFLITWGNVSELCLIFPVVGGAVGGGLGALSSFASLFFMRKAASPAIKVLIGLAVLIISILVAFAFAIVLIHLRLYL